MNPSTGPVGIPIAVRGTGFGTGKGNDTRVLIGQSPARVLSWTDALITAEIPGATTGAYSVFVERRQGSYSQKTAAGTFALTPLAISAMSPSSGPIGTPVAVSGKGFGPYDGGDTQVLLAGATVPIDSWSDTGIRFSIPGWVAAGNRPVVLRRRAWDGIVQDSPAASFKAVDPIAAGLNPSTGPIGISAAISGKGFGSFAGQAQTRVLFGTTTAQVLAWTDARITVDVPGLAVGSYPVTVERLQGNYFRRTQAGSFCVTQLAVASLSPSSGPIGSAFAIKGAGFGPIDGAYTRVLLGGSTAQISSWTDGQISAKVPGVAAGTYSLRIERISLDGRSQTSPPVNFFVRIPRIAGVSPASGKALSAFTLSGMDFGTYASTSASRVLIGGKSAAISFWADTRVKGVVPSGLAAGNQTVLVERTAQGLKVLSNPWTFKVLAGAASPADNPSAGIWNGPGEDFSAELMISAEEGGLMQSAVGVSLEVPSGALAEDTVLTMAQGRVDESPDSPALKAQQSAAIVPAGPPVEFGPEGTVFAVPVSLEFPYFISARQDEESVRLCYWDGSRWEPVPAEVDKGDKIVRAKTDHFSLYQVMAAAPAVPAAGSDFAMREIFVFPNPAKAGAKPRLHIEVGFADLVLIRIYNVAGQMVHQAELSGSPQLIGSQYAYEYAWEGGIPSGVYFYAVEARKGGDTLRKVGKFAVVR
jgi:hypothetical protein